MNKSVMKCCICNNENIGQFITINNKKYHLCCIEQLQQENKILKENAENNDKAVDKVNWENMLLKKENKQLKDNWSKLKEFIRKKQDYYRHFKDNRYRKFLSEFLDKMQELEGSDSNVKD